ncbi:MAG: hypothetical protein KC416_15555, partial [Myxococcales bacterium]|nr:hypothetical protein [Myxococcales bacterium]
FQLPSTPAIAKASNTYSPPHVYTAGGAISTGYLTDAQEVSFGLALTHKRGNAAALQSLRSTGLRTYRDSTTSETSIILFVGGGGRAVEDLAEEVEPIILPDKKD